MSKNAKILENCHWILSNVIFCDILVLVIKMKKTVVILILLVLCVCGCKNNDPYSEFKHSDLKNYDVSNRYYYVDYNNKYTHEYILTDITPENSEGGIEALFYKVGTDDYILLDEIESCNSSGDYKSKNYSYFYKDKLYINRCSGGAVLEYSLSGSKTTKIDLYSKFDTKLRLSSIINVDDYYIYYNGSTSYSAPTEVVKCSRESYKCE